MNRKSRRPVLILLASLVIIVVVVMMVNWRPISFAITNFISEPYDKAFYVENFVVELGVIYRIDDDGRRYQVLRDFSESFENVSTIRDLISIERGWTTFTILSPKAPNVQDYNTLRDLILLGESDFLDNRIEPSSEQARTGLQSLKASAVAPDPGMCCTKASLATQLLHFRNGDDVWFSAWYYLEQPEEYITLLDLESTFVRGYPGMRIRLQKGYLEFELAKWVPNEVYRQAEGEEISFPVGRWVFVEAHLLLSEKDDGIIQLFQDHTLIIDRRGQTLPFRDAVYDSLEVGLSAHSSGSGSAVLYLDDLHISAGPIR
jgi:hypothetical protein